MAIRSLAIGSLILIGSSALVGQLAVVAEPSANDGGGVAASNGPDVIVGALPNVSKYGTVNGISAYALGTTSCNLGDTILLWCDTNVPGLCTKEQHPVIAQNLYRLKDGRIEMIGMSWLKHGFCALAGTVCGPCTSDPWGCDALGIGCSDPYDSSLNGSQGGLGPRSQVNASTGEFPYPFTAPAAPAVVGRRLQVPIDDLNPSLNPGALYFGEGLYITKDDAAFNNDNNNASYRRMTVGSLTSGSYTLSFTGATIQQKAAIWAWKDHGLGLGQPDPDVFIEGVDVEGDGHFLVGYKASDNGDGTWHYEYAIYNMTSHRSLGSLEIAIPDGVTITNMDQHIVNHHSGEPFSTAPWDMASTDDALIWSTETFDINKNANALRFGVMFNFRFDADQPPAETTATLGLFRPGAAPNPVINVLGPAAGSTGPSCDLNGDGLVDGSDLGDLLADWGQADSPADLNADGTVDGSDLGILLGCWG